MFTISNFTENDDVQMLDALGAFQVIEWKRDLSVTPESSVVAYFSSEMNVRRRQVICDLSQAPVTIQAGAMQWMIITDYLNTPAESTVLHEDHLATLYYEYAMKCGNKFVAAWFEFNLNINNILVAFTSRKFKWDIASNIVGNTEVCEALRTSSARDFGLSGEVDVFESLVKISEITELVEREKKLDALRWNWMEDAIFFDYFTVERIFAFLLKLEMIERWISLDKERGNQLFRSIIESLKNDVQIPAEFR